MEEGLDSKLDSKLETIAFTIQNQSTAGNAAQKQEKISIDSV